MAKCVENSRRTIVVLTPNFIDYFRNLSQAESQAAHAGKILIKQFFFLNLCGVYLIFYHFVEIELDIWGLMGFRIAHKNALDERRSRVIIITKGNIGCSKHFQDELKAYINLSINFEWNEKPNDPEQAERQFFNSLRFAIAYPALFKGKCDQKTVENIDVV